KEDWEAYGGEYCEFTMCKENRDTMNAVHSLARILRVKPKDFTYAGTKDKRGMTTQRVSAHRITADKISGANMMLRGVVCGDFSYSWERLMLGDLTGNHFILTLRDAKFDSPADVEIAMESLRDHGFINYFGLQRFGTRVAGTHQIGLAMLKGEWEKAVDLIMAPDALDRQDIGDARRHFMQNQDAEKALRLFPKSACGERALLEHFRRKKTVGNFQQALDAIPRTLRTMYVHAYQSYVWNAMATERIREYGRTPVVGDLDDDAKGVDKPSNGSRHSKRPKKNVQVVAIQNEEELRKYSIEDVLLPMPGRSVLYPANKIGAKYVEFMAKHGMDPHKMQRENEIVNLHGGYRKLISRPANVKWYVFRLICRYNDPNIPLTPSAPQLALGAQPPASIPAGVYHAVIVEFTLSSSQYATMALREITRSGTSASRHRKLA
ncbi:pseudouridine synthase, partial [Blyttiomyces helicus]